MQENFYFKNIDEEGKEEIKEYAAKQIGKIEKLTKKDAEGIIKINCEYHKKHNCFTTSVTIDLPKGSFHAEESSHDVCKTLDLIFAKLLPQVKKAKTKLKSSIDRKRKTKRA